MIKISVSKRNKERFELEKQLHQQYAINNNASVGSFVSFLTTLLALFGWYGYVFVYSTNEFSKSRKFIDGQKLMTLDVFLLLSLVVVGILCFLSLVSLQLGYSNRNNQIIIDNIRNEYFKENKHKIFHKTYSPCRKNRWNFIQDYFNNFYWLFFASQIFVVISTMYKLCYGGNTVCCYVMFIVILQLLSIYFTIYFRQHYYNKYRKATIKTINNGTIQQ